MNMPTVSEKTKSALWMLGLLIVTTAGISLVPASWLGVKPKSRLYEPLNLSDISTIGSDADNDGSISWKEFVSESLGVVPGAVDGGALTPDPEIIANLNDENNITASFSKNLYIASTVLKHNNITDPTTEQETINQLLAQEAQKLALVPYTEKDLRSTKEGDVSFKKSYGNALAKTLDGLVTEENIVSDMEHFVNFLETGNEGEFIPLRNRVRELDTMIEELLNMDAPKSAASLHLLSINRILAFRNTIENLTRAYHDPMRANLALEAYYKDAVNAGFAYPEFSMYFHDQGVGFTQKETGYLFVTGYTKLQSQ